MIVPAESQDTLAGAGRLIADRYRLERKLGGGAMGRVWYATDELLQRPVAIKEIKLAPGVPAEEAAELRERALREARAIAVLSHPNVVTLYDVAREDGEPFVVMELVPSQSLAAILDEHGPLDDQQLAVICDGVAAGLDAAHRSGIVHRDVKPGNVLIGDDGRLKVSDFGISRNVAEHTITSTGILLGTPAFIAPEVAEGEAVTAAADLWGLGTTLFAATEGRPPYDVDNDPLATINEVVHGPVPEIRRQGPIGEVLTGLMVKDPAERMPLNEARRRVQHLLPEPGARPFGMLLDPQAPTVRVRKQVVQHPDQNAAQPNPEPHPPENPQAPSEHPGTSAEPSAPAPLAADPGPPPFPLQDPPAKSRTRRRSVPATIGLVLVAVLLFAFALVGGFATTRLAAGKPPLPDVPGIWSPSDSATRQPSEPLALAPYQDRAKHTDAPSGGAFGIRAPAEPGWRTFHSERNDIANSAVVSFVSPDGATEAAVQRYGDYFDDGATMREFEDQLASELSGQFTALQVDSATGAGDSRRISYTTSVRPVFTTAKSLVTRHTVAAPLKRGDDLWVIRVTGPTGEDDAQERLLDRIVPTFQTTAD
ncbi:serine/threonine-protein kinase [Saccharopolyspora halophila]|uniref:non-specific serine/threonine protein kinase n=1 Tax=Saccharopolyspora halophila TaxID=405551 RepID=A0ABP5SV14_9PSEU